MRPPVLTEEKPAPAAPAVRRYLPFLTWLLHYRRDDLVGDLIAGVIVAVMLVPQGMAYALLAGLPPQVGLYASILPLIIYGLLGTSRVLAVGPVAIVSLMVAAGAGMVAESGSAEYVPVVLTLAFMVAVIQGAMGLLRIGFVVNFLSHPVLIGFTAAAAIIIGFSQLKHVLGYSVPRFEQFYESVLYTAENLAQTNWVTLLIGVTAVATLLLFKYKVPRWLQEYNIPESVAVPIAKSAPLLIVVGGIILVMVFNLDERAGVSVVGDVPSGFPPLTLPLFDLSLWRLLLPTALAIAFVGYMESISVAKSLASKRREKVDANQELIALGAANLGASLTGGYPVTGGFSRSMVNYSAGARTGMASIITAGLVALSVIFLTPLFYYLPNTILAAIILVAVIGLIDIAAVRSVWRYSRRDGISLVATFVAVLALGIEAGILVGALISLILYLYRTSTPHIAVVGRLGHGETYRNVLRHPVQTWPEIALLRVDESLYFPNTKFLEDTVQALCVDQPDIEYLVLIGTAINEIDYSALEILEATNQDLRDMNVELHFAAIKGPVMDKLRESGFVDHVGADRFHLTTHDAMHTLGFV